MFDLAHMLPEVDQDTVNNFVLHPHEDEESARLAWEASLFDKPSDGIGSLLQHFLPYMVQLSTQGGRERGTFDFRGCDDSSELLQFRLVFVGLKWVS